MTQRQSETRRSHWAQGRYAKRKTWREGPRRKPHDEAMTRFDALLFAVLVAEVLAMLFIYGAVRPL